MSSENFSIRLPSRMKARLEVEAKARGRSRNNIIQLLLEKGLHDLDVCTAEQSSKASPKTQEKTK